jgi:hypothetical protein
MCYIIFHEKINEIATISSIDEQKTSITREQEPHGAKDRRYLWSVLAALPPWSVENDLKLSRKIEIEKINTILRPTGLKTRRSNSHKSQLSKYFLAAVLLFFCKTQSV